MLVRNNSDRRKLSRILICCLSSSLLITSNILPISALAIPQNSKNFIIAKSPDERQPEAVKKAIEQIPASQASIAPRKKPNIESPIQNRVSSNTEKVQPNPTPVRVRQPSPTPARVRQPSPTPARVRQPNPAPARVRQPNPTPARVRQPSPRRVSPPATPTYREINFADVALGILSKRDFESQGRYFHFYQFEGRENQLVQIRLIGSNDTRKTNNLSLNTLLFLHDPDNNVIVKKSSLEKSSDGDDAFIFARLPTNGTYKIAVTSQDPGDTGRYSLALRNDRASYTLDESGQLSAQSSTLKQNGGAYNISNFQGRKNQLVSIRVDSVDEEFSPYVALLNSQGQAIAIDKDKDKDGVYSALIDRARLPEDDTYYIVVTSKNPQERGKYRLTIF
ncbi:PPC domain-containing protein [Nostoc sp. WHI]|uniref:PPC domain-containing protein n=1 Tax=Nostoc sp. WHI TaxID=2650611 RepID=UPI0018C70714|nr:PPC domain-containing protein [Nostoc sp. WHI]MBG1271191.1 peptidase [Nostoc sp. WHI]